MALRRVIGQDKVADMLQNALRRQRLVHAYIFFGSDRSGMKKTAFEFAKAVNCLRNKDDSCDECINCVRISHHNHPDIHTLTPDGKTIKIEQIRQLQRQTSYQTNDLNKKVIIIESAEMMTTQAANSLLKFLEEPFNDVMFLLLVENMHLLLPTIISRCQLVPFRSLPPNVIVNELMLTDMPRQTAAAAASIANSIEDARELTASTWFTHALKLVTTFTELIRSPGQAIAFIHDRILTSEVGQQHLSSFLDLMILWYQDMLKVSLGCQPLTFLDFRDKLLKQTSYWTDSCLVQAVEQLLLAQWELNQYVSPQSVLEGWVLSVQEV